MSVTSDAGVGPVGRSTRERLLLGAACTPVVAYLVFVWHYAVNVPSQDDWFQAPVVSEALHGRLILHNVWGQYTENRLVVPRLFFIAFGIVDHLNLKSVVIFSAVVFVASYFLVLAILRAYLRRPLTFVPVFLLGIVWFSLVDVTNALWAFALSWYLVLLFLAIMIYSLFIWPRNRIVAFSLAVLAAICGSLSWMSGFVLWPVGLVGLLWIWTGQHKRYGEVAVWSAVGLLTAALYFRGYRFGKGCIGPAKNCSVAANARHPAHLANYYLRLVGSVVGVVGVRRWSLLGAVICVAVGVVIVLSLKERRHDTRVPLPLLLITFALLFDLMIALGRAGERTGVGSPARYTMPNVVLLVGVLAFACAHPPDLRAIREGRYRRHCLTVAFVALGVGILALSVYSTRYGVREARAIRARQIQSARTVVNLDRIPRTQRGCYVSHFVWSGTFRPGEALTSLHRLSKGARRDHLMFFESGAFRKYRALGPPVIPSTSRAISCISRVSSRHHPLPIRGS